MHNKPSIGEEHTGDMQEQLRIQQNFRFRRVYEDQREIFSPYHQKKERESRINNHHQSTSLDSPTKYVPVYPLRNSVRYM